MKVVAFFKLKDKTRINEFLEWVQGKQKIVFESEIEGLKNFNVYMVIEDNDFLKEGNIIQIFDWDFSPKKWADMLDSFKTTCNQKIIDIREEWLEYCDENSTKIIYAS